MFGRLFKRKRLSPQEKAEKERQIREAEKARRQAELEMAKQRGFIESGWGGH